MQQKRTGISKWLESASAPTFAAYSIVAAFTTYFCMYAFRKPFTAGVFADSPLWGIDYKAILVTSQLAGYTLSKFVGIKVISEMPPAKRAIGIVLLIAVAELALLCFAVVPTPWNFPFLFLNGLPLGMVFGLVLSFLEGRRVTEALSAGLCASFIVASGFVKYVGRTMIVDFGISEYWMPLLAGLCFLLPLLIGVFMLAQIPPPSERDESERSQRVPMHRAARWALFRRHAFGLTGLLVVYVLLTVIRSIRDDYAVEIWEDLGHSGEPSVFAKSETAVMFGVILINGSAICIRDNRRALIGSITLILSGLLLVLSSIWGHRAGLLDPFAFMVLIGLGTYVPYVAFHTTIFERLLAAFRERGNIVYLMYLADATGYLGYIAVLVAKNFLPQDIDFLRLFTSTTLWLGLTAFTVAVILMAHYLRTAPRTRAVLTPQQNES